MSPEARLAIYIVLHESKCDMAKYFTSRLIYFHEPEGVKIKPESEISSHITLVSVISGLFHARYLHISSLLVTLGVKLVVKLFRGSPQTWLGRLH